MIKVNAFILNTTEPSLRLVKRNEYRTRKKSMVEYRFQSRYHCHFIRPLLFFFFVNHSFAPFSLYSLHFDSFVIHCVTNCGIISKILMMEDRNTVHLNNLLSRHVFMRSILHGISLCRRFVDFI